MKNYFKYPRTKHLPHSVGTNDDKTLKSDKDFKGKRVIGTIKMDGENFSGYKDHSHARSVNSGYHSSRGKSKDIWFQVAHLLKDNERVCGENLYAKHNIKYDNLKSYLLIFSVWRDKLCLSWNDTIKFSNKLGLNTVDSFYDGIYDLEKIEEKYEEYKRTSTDDVEGYVIRLAESFDYEDFNKSVAKFVEPNFRNEVQETDEHWMNKKVIPNTLK
jgi:RNA ligase